MGRLGQGHTAVAWGSPWGCSLTLGLFNPEKSDSQEVISAWSPACRTQLSVYTGFLNSLTKK